MTTLNPYLNFRGNAREAMEFYHSVFGGDLDVSTFGDFQMPGIGEDEKDKVMHSQLNGAGGLTLMGSDVPNQMPLASESNIVLSLSGADEAELRAHWDKLADGGQVSMPLSAAPWGDTFGQLTDRFGTSWLFNIAGQH